MTDEEKLEKEQVEQEINDISRSIDHSEDTDYMYLRPELRELRHRILYVHARLEASVGILLWKWITDPGKDRIPREVRVEMGSRFDYVISEADFARKVSLAQELNLIPGKMKSNLFAVNNLRLIFSHPKSHEAETRKLLDRREYLKALRILKVAFDGMNVVFATIIAKAKFEEEMKT